MNINIKKSITKKEQAAYIKGSYDVLALFIELLPPLLKEYGAGVDEIDNFLNDIGKSIDLKLSNQIKDYCNENRIIN